MARAQPTVPLSRSQQNQTTPNRTFGLNFMHLFCSSVSTVSYLDHPHDDDFFMKPAVQYENTYQLEPSKRFPVAAIKQMLSEVLSSYLRDETYDPEFCRQMTKTISDVCMISLLSI